VVVASVIDLDGHHPSIAAGSADAFASWMAGAEPAMRDVLRSFAAAVDVEAVLQEALLRVWQVAPRFSPDGRPNGLLRLGVRIAKNLAISEARRKRTEAVDPDDLDREVAADVPAPPDPLLRRAIEECRQRLPQKPALALGARLESAGAEPDAILAERLGMRTNTFLQNFGRARRLLLECLEQRGVRLEVESA
jgi:RNA polymerase sigma-70 factor (ECF subfamily)